MINRGQTTLCTPPINGNRPVFLFSFFYEDARIVPQIFSPFRFFIFLSSFLVRRFVEQLDEFSTLDPFSLGVSLVENSKPRIILPA